MTILPNQSGEIRLTANLLDTRRRFAPPAKGAGSGRMGGHREKDGGRRNGYGQAGRFALRRISGYAAPLRAANERGGEREGPAPAEAAVRKREIPESERFRADLGEKKREKEEFFGRVEKERRR